MTLTQPLDVLRRPMDHGLHQLHGLLDPVVTRLHVGSLPDHHRDPSDRILIAQALVEVMTLVSADSKFAPYPVTILW